MAKPDAAFGFDAEGSLVGLIAGLLLGGVALLAAGATEVSSFSLGAIALLAVGPVAYAGLTRTLSHTAKAISTAMKVPEMTDPGGKVQVRADQAVVVKSTELRQRTTSATEASPKPLVKVPAAEGVPVDKRTGTAQTPRWKPFPWNWLPDPVAFAWGAAEIAFIAPLMSILVCIVVPWQKAINMVWMHQRLSWLRSRTSEAVRGVFQPLGKVMLRDARNYSYLYYIIGLGVFIPALFFWAMYRHSQYGFEFPVLFLYHILRLGPRYRFFAHLHTLVHKEGHDHRGFFKGPFSFLNCGVTEFWIGPFYGVVPLNYSIAHNKIHHRWHNDVDDVHTNLDLDRTKPSSFLLYTPRFTLYFTGLSPLALFLKRKEYWLAAKLTWGMALYYGATALLMWWNPVFCIAYWLFPHMEAIVLLCAISYLWHAFVEESDPGNQYVNSVTILDGHDNVWNEDYHVVHHHAPGTHWTDIPAHFEARRDKYAAVTATIFRDTEEGMLLTWLFQNDWDKMAEHFVDLNGKLTHEQKKELIKRRLSVIVGETGRDGRRLQREWAADDTIRHFETE